MATDKIHRILVATDGSNASVAAARYAARLLGTLKPRVTLLHVVPNESIPIGTTQFGPRAEVEIERTLWEGAQGILDLTRKPFDELSIPLEVTIRRGEAAEEIVAAARRGRADLVVLGTRGGTTDAVMERSGRPVLVVNTHK